MRKRLLSYGLSLLLVLSSLGTLGLAQVTTTARISGTVADPQGALIPKADVVIKNNETGAEYKLKTSDEGTYVVASLPIGIYTVMVTAAGFKQTVVTNVKTEVASPATVNITLEVGAASETVTVTS